MLAHTLYVQPIARNYSVDPDRLASSEVADQDLYCFHICTVNSQKRQCGSG